MRLWSLHPRHLDAAGLVALWREGLLARAVLRGATSGYRHHPQLARFRAHRNPLACLDTYLAAVCDEADRRGYRFDRAKLGRPRVRARLPVTRGQVTFEWEHLRTKLRRRRIRARAAARRATAKPRIHPLFRIVSGPVAAWERRAMKIKKKKGGFSEDVLTALQKGQTILGIRAGTRPHRTIGIWAVVVEGRVFVRSWSVKPGGWYRTFLEEPRGTIEIAGREIPVRAIRTRSERLKDAVSRAYLEKYHTPGSLKYARDLGRKKARETTTELAPL
ncbi:MAG TPA: DUF2255 family protein [Vicinamibacterales bacterium]|nr:DUF2255 family protein [Vicinamibacterales bacterium]